MSSIIIGIAGGSGSGKSTFTNRLKARFQDQVSVIYHDNYYRAQSDIPMEERKKTNYDHPDALETDLLLEHLQELREGKTVDTPVYDFSQHTRSQLTIPVEPRKVILVEGILIFADERLRDQFDMKIFVDADADERIMRRIQRDVQERGREMTQIMEQYRTTVKPMHYLYVEPTRYLADFVLNSGMNDQAFHVVSAWIEQALSEED